MPLNVYIFTGRDGKRIRIEAKTFDEALRKMAAHAGIRVLTVIERGSPHPIPAELRA